MGIVYAFTNEEKKNEAVKNFDKQGIKYNVRECNYGATMILSGDIRTIKWELIVGNDTYDETLELVNPIKSARFPEPIPFVSFTPEDLDDGWGLDRTGKPVILDR